MCSPTPLSAAPLDAIERELHELSAHLAVGMSRWIALVGEFDERRGWVEEGLYSCAHWLSWRCGIGLRAAREQVRVARTLRGLPLTSAAFAAGELSYSKVRAITRAATPENEEYLVLLGRHASGGQLERIICRYRGVTGGRADVAHHAYEDRYLYTRHAEDGSLVIEARVPADDGAVLLAALEQADRSERAARGDDCERNECSAEHTSFLDRESGRAVPLQARRADALIALARAGLSNDDAGADPVEVVVHVDIETLSSDAQDGRCDLEGGPALAPETARRLACDGGVRRIIERDGRSLTVGRRSRTVPPALKRALRDRDQGCCRFPGCTHTRFLHAHHIHHWARGGGTNLDNLVQLCSYHHRLVHEGGYQVERAGGQGLRFVRPNGRAIDERPAPAVATGPPLPEQNEARGIKIDAETSRPLSAGHPFDMGMAIDGLLQRDGLLNPKPPDPPEAPGAPGPPASPDAPDSPGPPEPPDPPPPDPPPPEAAPG